MLFFLYGNKYEVKQIKSKDKKYHFVHVLDNILYMRCKRNIL